MAFSSNSGEARGSSSSRWILPLVTLLFLLASWELVVRFFQVREVILPAPLDITAQSWGRRAIIVKHFWPTVRLILIAFGVSTVLGMATGLIISFWRAAREMVLPIAVGFESIPKVAFIPLFLIWFGTSDIGLILLAFLLAYFPMVVNTNAGLTDVDGAMLQMGRAFMASRWQEFVKVRLPNAMPYIFSGMKITMTRSVLGVIVAELVSGERGLGYLLLFWSVHMDTSRVMGVLVILSVCAVALFGLVVLAERKAIYWGGND